MRTTARTDPTASPKVIANAMTGPLCFLRSTDKAFKSAPTVTAPYPTSPLADLRSRITADQHAQGLGASTQQHHIEKCILNTRSVRA